MRASVAAGIAPDFALHQKSPNYAALRRNNHGANMAALRPVSRCAAARISGY